MKVYSTESSLVIEAEIKWPLADDVHFTHFPTGTVMMQMPFKTAKELFEKMSVELAKPRGEPEV